MNVCHTNKHGYQNAKNWSPITKKDLKDFFSVLFLMSVQKRKDKPSDWFSDNPLLESKIAKRVTTGRKFGKMLQNLHCCDPNEDGKNNDGEYDPSSKIMDLKSELEKRWTTIFIPGQQLSLDETLLWAFGCMKNSKSESSRRQQGMASNFMLLLTLSLPLFLASVSTQESLRIRRQLQNQLKRQCRLSSSYVNPFAEPSAQFTLTGSIAQLIC
jgi:hypothetical protein